MTCRMFARQRRGSSSHPRAHWRTRQGQCGPFQSAEGLSRNGSGPFHRIMFVSEIYVRGCAAVQQIADWLEKLGMSEYAACFAENKIDTAVLDHVMETNLRGPYLLARAFAPALRRHKAGRIVNIASLAGIAPGGSSIAYASSKAGLIHLTHCLAVALAPDVTVNRVAPGLVEGTRMAERVPEDTRRQARMQAVLGRTASVEDIAEQVLAFCRTETVTGQVLVVDGGMPAGMR